LFVLFRSFDIILSVCHFASKRRSPPETEGLLP
jgi:hypothetical protein